MHLPRAAVLLRGNGVVAIDLAGDGAAPAGLRQLTLLSG
jgi:hypothetical protein